MSIVVFGSINMDLIARTAKLPTPGQTVSGRSFTTLPGGKGANQAVACARLGAPTTLVGRIGSDSFGTALLAGLQGYGVDVSGVLTDPNQPSGVAAIAVDDHAENTIIVIPGANGTVEMDDVKRLEAAFDKGATVMLIQLEIPDNPIFAAMEVARQRGATIIFDPAPARILPNGIYRRVDVITPNETEAAILCGFDVITEEDAARAAKVFFGRGVKRVVIKMGSKGAYWKDHDSKIGFLVPPFPVQAIDTVGAGDAFNGALAVALSEGLSFEEAMRWGAAAGALSTTKAGAQPSMPQREDLLAFLSV